MSFKSYKSLFIIIMAVALGHNASWSRPTATMICIALCAVMITLIELSERKQMKRKQERLYKGVNGSEGNELTQKLLILVLTELYGESIEWEENG